MPDSSIPTPVGITKEMIELGARSLAAEKGWGFYGDVVHERMRDDARNVLEAALAGRTVVDPAQNEYAMRDFGLDVDHEAGGVYVSLNHNPVARTEAWGDDVNVDYDADGKPTGVEILRPRRAITPDDGYCHTCGQPFSESIRALLTDPGGAS